MLLQKWKKIYESSDFFYQILLKLTDFLKITAIG